MAPQAETLSNGPASSAGAAPPVETIDHPWLKPETVERRAYQVNLAVTAATEPSLVVLPTGMGKTVVALLVAADRLKAQPDARILLLAPTKPLVEQHARFFREHLRLPDGADPEAAVVAFSGAVPPERRRELWQGARFVAATPQVIENDLIAQRYDLATTSLVIFDEAHRATGDYPYVWLADRYMRDNPRGHRMGLTASPGSAAEKILEICGDLGFTHMEIRTERDEDVRPYLHDLDMQWEKVPLPDALKSVAEALRGALSSRVQSLRALDLLRGVSSPSRRDLLRLAGEIQSRIRNADDPDRGLFDAMSIQAQAMKISHALELVETQGAQAFLSYWQRLQNEADGKSSSRATAIIVQDPRIQAAVERAAAVVEDDPKMERVVDAVRTELTVSEDPRIIVFANYRETCERLTERLARLPGCRPVRFVGQSSREGDKGLTQKEQQTLLQEFRDGTHNVLVATSVAEEGLDIPQTDLVIFHEPVPSEIRAIQRRGRTARRRAGRAVVLMYAGTRDEAYHWASRRREEAMRRELRALRNTVVRELRGRRQTRLPEAGADAPSPEAPTHAPPAPPVPPPPAAPTQQTASASPPAPSPVAHTAPPAGAAPTPSGSTSAPQPPLSAFFDRPKGVDGRVRVLVDHRESRSGVVKALERMGLDLEPVQLAVADYALSDRVAVERKNVEDFLSSLLDGRLFAQARQLVAYPRPILIIEGEGLTTTRNIPRSSIFGAMASLVADFGIAVVQTGSAEETAHLLAAIAKREQTEQRRDAPVRLDKMSLSDHDRRRFILEGLPNVSAVLARRLLEHFGSVERVMTASTEDLMEVEGVGRKTATEIRRVLTGGPRDAP